MEKRHEFKCARYSSKIAGATLVTGAESQNDKEKHDLAGSIGVEYFRKIAETAESCPVEVIKYLLL
jgi:hypothetical protein